MIMCFHLCVCIKHVYNVLKLLCIHIMHNAYINIYKNLKGGNHKSKSAVKGDVIPNSLSFLFILQYRYRYTYIRAIFRPQTFEKYEQDNL